MANFAVFAQKGREKIFLAKNFDWLVFQLGVRCFLELWAVGCKVVWLQEFLVGVVSCGVCLLSFLCVLLSWFGAFLFVGWFCWLCLCDLLLQFFILGPVDSWRFGALLFG